MESASSSCNRSNAFFLVHDFLKCIATEFKRAFIYFDMILQGPTFVASIAAKLVLCATQWIEVRKGFTLSFNRAATPFCLPIMVDAPSDPKPTHLSKSSPHSFMLIVSVSNIIHAYFFLFFNMQLSKKYTKRKSLLNKTSKNNKMTGYGYIRGLIYHNTEKPRVPNSI